MNRIACLILFYLGIQNIYAGGIVQLPNMSPLERFNYMADTIINMHKRWARNYGANLSAIKLFQQNTINARAEENGNEWQVILYGGVLNESTFDDDVFALGVCHEIGHFFAGFPFHIPPQQNLATEGHADYYATSGCLPLYFQADDLQRAINSRFAAGPGEFIEADQKCWTAYPSPLDEQLRGQCIRSIYAAIRYATWLNQGQSLSINTPDVSVVPETIGGYPSDQCRLDTMVSGVFCQNVLGFETQTIPGRRYWRHNIGKNDPNHGQFLIETKLADDIAASLTQNFSCNRQRTKVPEPFHSLNMNPFDPQPWGYKPRCWYKPIH